jgi:hypothetical protein
VGRLFGERDRHGVVAQHTYTDFFFGAKLLQRPLAQRSASIPHTWIVILKVITIIVTTTTTTTIVTVVIIIISFYCSAQPPSRTLRLLFARWYYFIYSY